MKLTLVTASGGRHLTVESVPFTIGREILAGIIDPAEQTGRDVLKHISKEHAILRIEQGLVIIADADSLNGTSCNGVPVTGDGMAVLPGDVVSLAKRIELILDYDPVQTIVPPGNPALTAVAGPSAGSVVEIGRLPCRFVEVDGRLVNGSSPELDARDRLESRFVLTGMDDRYYLAPLSFDPGIVVDRQPVRPGRVELKFGSSITLVSGSIFKLIRQDAVFAAKTRGSETKAGGREDPDENRTIYLQDATRFMHVFDDKSPDLPGSGGVLRQQEEHAAKNITRRFMALGGKILLLFGLAAAVVASLILLYRNTESAKATRVCAGGTPQQCLQATDQILARKYSKRIDDLAKKALVGSVAPAIADNLASRNYDGVADVIGNARSRAANVGGAGAILDLFSFVARVDRFVSANVAEERIDIEDKQWFTEIAAIDDDWLAKKNVYGPVIEEIKQLDAALNGVFADFYSNLNENQENKVYYLDKAVEFKEELKRLMAEDDLAASERLIEEFSRRHTLLKNTDRWLTDLREYGDVLRSLEKTDVFTLEAAVASFAPQTELFREIVVAQSKRHLPATANLETIASARLLWEQGRVADAIAKLETVESGPASDQIFQKISFLREVASLNDIISQDGVAKCPAIGRLHQLLSSAGTSFQEKVLDEYGSCRVRAEQLIVEFGEKAAADFATYRRQGMISGRMRMASKITDDFRRQARLLAAAAAARDFVISTAEQFRLDIAVNRQTTFDEIANEHRAQISRLEESAILDQPLRQEKVMLLRTDKVNGWQK